MTSNTKTDIEIIADLVGVNCYQELRIVYATGAQMTTNLDAPYDMSPSKHIGIEGDEILIVKEDGGMYSPMQNVAFITCVFADGHEHNVKGHHSVATFAIAKLDGSTLHHMIADPCDYSEIGQFHIVRTAKELHIIPNARLLFYSLQKAQQA